MVLGEVRAGGGELALVLRPLARRCGRRHSGQNPDEGELDEVSTADPCTKFGASAGVVYDGAVRVGLVSPYSYTYPGGVGRHVEALAEELSAQGHDVRLLAPYDPDDRLARVMHRGARPDRRPLPDYLVPLGRTVGLPMNGAVSNLGCRPRPSARWAASCATAATTWCTCTSRTRRSSAGSPRRRARVPLVGTFHCYSRQPRSRTASPPTWSARGGCTTSSHVRIAVSEAARWTSERFYGGRYRIVPNGVDLAAARPAHARRSRRRWRCCSWAAPRRARACRCCCARSRRCAAPASQARLTVAGATAEEVEPLLLDPEGVRVVGRVSDEEKWRLLGQSDLLCAPSLGGESFGMVLTEAFASAHAGRGIGHRGLSRRGPRRLGRSAGARRRPRRPRRGPAATLRSTATRRAPMAAAARERAERFAWPRVAEEVTRGLRGRDRACPAPARARERVKRAARAWPRPMPARRCAAAARVDRARAAARTPADGRARSRARAQCCGRRRCGGIGLAALAVEHIGIESIGARDRGGDAGLGAVGVRAHVRVDARCGPRRGTRSCAPRCPALGAPPRRRPRHDDRRADVGDAARAPG